MTPDLGTDLAQDSAQVGAVVEIAVVQAKPNAGLVGILVDVIETPGVDGRRPPDDSVNFVTLLEQQLGQIGTILAIDTGY